MGDFALVKRLLPSTRYIIVDIPASLPLQMSYAHHLGYRAIHRFGPRVRRPTCSRCCHGL